MCWKAVYEPGAEVFVIMRKRQGQTIMEIGSSKLRGVTDERLLQESP